MAEGVGVGSLAHFGCKEIRERAYTMRNRRCFGARRHGGAATAHRHPLGLTTFVE